MLSMKAFCLAAFLAADAPRPFPSELSLSIGDSILCGLDERNFFLSGMFWLTTGAEASLRFHTDAEGRGYEVLFHNGPIDGTRKTGSLSHVRNLYRAMASEI